MAVILLAVVWLDNSEVPLLVGFLICFPLLYNTCHTALESVDGELLEMADVYHMRPVDKLTGIYLPAVFPVVTEGAKSAVSLTVKVVIAAEVLAQTRVSIGLLMQQDSVMFEIADVSEDVAREAFRLAMHKLPIKCKFVKKESGEANEN